MRSKSTRPDGWTDEDEAGLQRGLADRRAGRMIQWSDGIDPEHPCWTGSRWVECQAPKLCNKRERELGSNLIYVSGCARDGSPRLYTGESGKENEEIEAPE